MERKTALGLFAVVGVWLTAGLALPFVNVLTMFTPEQLLAARGFLTALMALMLLRGKIVPVDRWTFLVAALIPFASLGLFKGVRAWGAGPTIIVITATPLVNFLFSWFAGRRVARAALVGFGLILGGVVLARWGGDFQWEGFLWSVFGTVFNGLLYEAFARAQSKPLQRCFWGSLGIGTIGALGSLSADWGQAVRDSHLQLALIGFAFVGGFLYWLANLAAFTYLPKDTASVLAQGETPAVILIAALVLDEHLAWTQWTGVIIALVGAWYVSRWLAAQKASDQTPS